MRLAKALAAAALLSSPVWGLTLVGPTAAPNASHFDLGRQAFKSAQYELTLHEMMMVLIERPKDARAREYMRLAGEKLIAAGEGEVSGERRKLLEDYSSELDLGRRQAMTWMGWVLQSRASSGSRRWARGYDDAERVMIENPLHEDAKEAQRAAREGLVRSIGDGAKLAEKDRLIYVGLFSTFEKRNHEGARQALRDALALEGAAELDEERIRYYLNKLAPEAPVEPPVVRKPKPVKKAPAAAPEPGQWAFAQGRQKFEAGEIEEAIELFERALGEAPDHAEAREALVKARAALVEALKTRRQEAAQLYTVGLMLYGQGHRAEAIQRWRRVVKLDPEHNYAARALRHAEDELAREKAQ